MKRLFFFNKQFVLFVFVSGMASGVNFLSRIQINHYFSYATSIVFAYILGIITGFTLNKIFVFKTEKSETVKRFIIFVLVNISAMAITLSVSLLFNNIILPYVGWEWYRAEVAHFIGIASPAFTSYYLHKRFTFG